MIKGGGFRVNQNIQSSQFNENHTAKNSMDTGRAGNAGGKAKMRGYAPLHLNIYKYIDLDGKI